MRRFVNVSNIVSMAIITAVAGMVSYANWRDGQRSRTQRAAPSTHALGAATTSREDLEKSIKDMEAHLRAHPDDVRSAVSLADTLLREARVTLNAGLAVGAEQLLKKALI